MKKFYLTFGIFFLVVFVTTGAYLLESKQSPQALMLRFGDYFFNLVTTDNSLGDYAPTDLVELSDLGAHGLYIRKIAYEHLQDLVLDMDKEGIAVKILSPYRSYERQKAIYDYYKFTEPDFEQYSAPPGHSEHQLGTTVDFGVGNARIDFEDAFGDTTQGKWLAEKAWKYGFALSFPVGKEEITGFKYEPWHYRFIGVAPAREWHESGLTLFEYLAQLPQYYAIESYLGQFVKSSDKPEVYYVADNGSKRYIISPEVFLSYGIAWDEITIVTPEIIKALPDTFLIRAEGEPRVYRLETDRTRRWVVAGSVFNELGYSWEDVVAVSSVELQGYTQGSPVTSPKSSAALIGRSLENRPLHVVSVGEGPLTILFIGGLHTGTEENTRILAEEMIQYFISRPSEVPPNITLSIITSINPDGTMRGIHNNAQGVDLNRNWPTDNWRSDPYHPTYGNLSGAGGAFPLSEPETKTLYDFMLDTRPVMTFVWHSQARLVEDNNSGIADAAAAVYASAADYLHIEEWEYYEVTGGFTDAMAKVNIAAADIELATHSDIDFERNLKGVGAVLHYISNFYSQ